ncbi:diphosphomevalonate decarboxylase [Mycobacterium marinum]|uniref:diphosphomevalonate decarboxylase n=1 Tax=Mycobacterium marinum TaxID=1781 RepID=UPI0021C2A24A|nr:diphosphomevalonate decarboxylase [Mycobacterium marinum]GJO39006.1 diphosphomevalonate decarboxylase [Mycobacterium marinum]
MSPAAATAVAHPNIALIKYWGKRDEEFMLPMTSSLSMTLDIFPTTTTVEVGPTGGGVGPDIVMMAGKPAPEAFSTRVTEFLDLLRVRVKSRAPAIVDTHNAGPTGAGLASSASGFAALAAAACAAYGLDTDVRELSRLARRGSGSASRSVFGGFSVWHAGAAIGADGDAQSYAEPIDVALDLALVVVVVEAGAKQISSRAAMSQTVKTSPLYRAWADASGDDLHAMQAALATGDLHGAGAIAEANAMGMHATMLAARPAVRYISAASLQVIDRVVALRGDGIAAYLTMDAGPNVKVLCSRDDAALIAASLKELSQVQTVVVAHPGPGVALVEKATR